MDPLTILLLFAPPGPAPVLPHRLSPVLAVAGTPGLFARLPKQLPPLSDCGRFDFKWDYDLDLQEARLKDHLDSLGPKESLHGWCDGRWEHERRQCEFYLKWWRLVEQATHPNRADACRRESLAEIEALVGPWMYERGWKPPRMPDLALENTGVTPPANP